MFRRILFLALAVSIGGIALPSGARAQEEGEVTDDAVDNPTLVISNYQCEWSHVGEIVEYLEKVDRPVYQALVNEGKLMSWGSYIHEWADEWNVNFYSVAASKEAFFAAWEEAGKRLRAAAGEDAENPIADYCSVHRDGIYVLGPRTDDSDSDE